MLWVKKIHLWSDRGCALWPAGIDDGDRTAGSEGGLDAGERTGSLLAREGSTQDHSRWLGGLHLSENGQSGCGKVGSLGFAWSSLHKVDSGRALARGRGRRCRARETAQGGRAWSGEVSEAWVRGVWPAWELKT